MTLRGAESRISCVPGFLGLLLGVELWIRNVFCVERAGMHRA